MPLVFLLSEFSTVYLMVVTSPGFTKIFGSTGLKIQSRLGWTLVSRFTTIGSFAFTASLSFCILFIYIKKIKNIIKNKVKNYDNFKYFALELFIIFIRKIILLYLLK